MAVSVLAEASWFGGKYTSEGWGDDAVPPPLLLTLTSTAICPVFFRLTVEILANSFETHKYILKDIITTYWHFNWLYKYNINGRKYWQTGHTEVTPANKTVEVPRCVLLNPNFSESEFQTEHKERLADPENHSWSCLQMFRLLCRALAESTKWTPDTFETGEWTNRFLYSVLWLEWTEGD